MTKFNVTLKAVVSVRVSSVEAASQQEAAVKALASVSLEDLLRRGEGHGADWTEYDDGAELECLVATRKGRTS